MTDILGQFSQTLIADILATAEADGTGTSETFAGRCFEMLEAAGITDNTFYAHYRARGAEIHGIGRNEEIGSLDLFTSDFDPNDPARTISRRDVDARIARLAGFVERCRNGLRADIDDTTELHDMCVEIEKALTESPRVRMFVLTNAHARGSTGTNAAGLDGLPVTAEVWDVARLHRLDSSGTRSEPIVVDLDPPLPCLAAAASGADTDTAYHVLLAIVPGSTLAGLYGRYGTQLLELNVRSFLQARGAVNAGIRTTILREPARFLAYNNGITATASRVDRVDTDQGSAISRIYDLQIVNGGQTTASLFHAQARDRADLTDIHVQAKINVVTPELLGEIVPAISRYSNTQNRVSAVDLRANDPFHVDVERVTRTLWAPATPESGGQETHWFYERARGQYADALNRERTPARQRAFKLVNPTRQKFAKSDLAKYENSWAGLPHLVSRGAEKNFREFMDRIERAPFRVDRAWCQALIAKAILFKQTETIVGRRNFGGYRANIVTYIIAKLADAVDQRLDLDAIWRDQRLPPAVAAALDSLAGPVHQIIVTPPAGTTNVGEWAKRVDCWDRVQQIPWTPPDTLLLDSRPARTTTADTDDPDAAAVADASAISAEAWFGVAAWAKETGNLALWQRGLAFSLGKLDDRGQTPSVKHAVQGTKLMEQAVAAGYRAPLP